MNEHGLAILSTCVYLLLLVMVPWFVYVILEGGDNDRRGKK